MLGVDPDATHLQRLTADLRRLGWRVWACGSADEADRVLDRHADQIRVTLVDLELPGLLGARTLAGWEHAHPGLVRCGMAAEVLGSQPRRSGCPTERGHLAAGSPDGVT